MDPIFIAVDVGEFFFNQRLLAYVDRVEGSGLGL